MDRPRQNDHLGVNKIGKNIRKSPLHQPNFAANANAARPQGQPQVYNISKNDFRSIVQQLTGSPSRDTLPRPPQNNSPKPQNTRLQRIRPAPLTQINRPPVPTMPPVQHHPHGFVRPPPPQAQQQQQQQPMMVHGDQFWSNTAESPISEYMRYLQSSPLGHAVPSGNQMQPGHEHRPYMPVQPQSQPQPYMTAQAQTQPQAQPHMMHGSQPHMNMQSPLPPPGLVPSPMPRNIPPPQFNGPVPVTPTLPSPRFGFPSPRYNCLGPLNSPTSQFAPPSPTGYPNMFSPRSPYPLLSPGVQYPQPLTPNFSFSQVAQSGNHGGPPQPPPSPGLMFPLSPGFFPTTSPRWGNY